jgi:Arc/MetJ-type ribon-helix-helix transcriptional regulator
MRCVRGKITKVVTVAPKSISMPHQFTPEQERRIQAVVNAGAYPSAEEALNAALAVVETVAVPDFKGTQYELEILLLDGLNSGEPIEADDGLWNRLARETDRVAAEHEARKPSQ